MSLKNNSVLQKAFHWGYIYIIGYDVCIQCSVYIQWYNIIFKITSKELDT